MPTPGRSAAPGIFISYRRGDGDHAARTIYQRLSTRFGRDRVFLDIDNLRAGANFPKEIDRALQSCAVCIAVIGDRWLTGGKSNENRLTSPTDFVRIELAAALKRPNLAVFPVLVSDEVKMPSYDVLPDDLQELPSRQAVRIPNDYFEAGMADLLKGVDGALVAARRRQKIDTLLTRAREAFETGDYETAIAHVEELLELEPEAPDALALLDRARSGAEAAGERNEAIRIAVDQTRKRLAEGDLEEAIRHADEALALNPGLTEARELRLQAEAAQQQRLRERAERRAQQQRERVRSQEEQQRREAADRQAAEAQRAAQAQRSAEAQQAAEAAEAAARQAAAEAAVRERAETARKARAEQLAREESERRTDAHAQRQAVEERGASESAEEESVSPLQMSTAQPHDGGKEIQHTGEPARLDPSLPTTVGMTARFDKISVRWAAAVLVVIAGSAAFVAWRSYFALPFVEENLLAAVTYAGEIHGLTFPPEDAQQVIRSGHLVLAAGESRFALWELQTGQDRTSSLENSTLATVPTTIRKALFTRSGAQVALATENTEPNAVSTPGVSLWRTTIRIREGQPVPLRSIPRAELLALNGDGEYVAVRSITPAQPATKSSTALQYGPIEVFNVTTGRKAFAVSADGIHATEAGRPAVALSANAEYIAVGSGSPSIVEVWERRDTDPSAPPTLTKRQSWKIGGEGVGRVLFSNDGKYLAAAIEGLIPYRFVDWDVPLDGIVVWDLTSGELVARMPGGGSAIAFSPDGRYLASGEEDHVRILAVPGEQYHRLVWDSYPDNDFTWPVTALAFDPSGDYLVAAKRTRWSPVGVPPGETNPTTTYLKVWRRR